MPSIRALSRRVILWFGAIPVVVLAAVLVAGTFGITRMAADQRQRALARFGAREVENVFTSFVAVLGTFTITTRFYTAPPNQQEQAVRALLRREPRIDEVIIVGRNGREQSHVSRLDATGPNQQEPWKGRPEYVTAVEEARAFVGRFRINPITREPVITVAVPIATAAADKAIGMVVASVRAKALWDAFADLPTDPGQVAYVADENGRVIVHPNPTVVFRGDRMGNEHSGFLTRGLDGRWAVARRSTVTVGQGTFTVVAERSLASAYGLVALNIAAAALATTAVALGFLVAHRTTVRSVVEPLEVLATAAEEIGGPHVRVSLSASAAAEHWRLANTIETVGRRISETVNSLERANKEKELLLREVHHRVGNNLQVISSLISLQARFGSDASPNQLGLLRGTHDRIMAMAHAHEHLYARDDLSYIRLDHYLTELVSAIHGSYGNDAPETEVEITASPCTAKIDVAIPFGLVVNELVTNAFRHAFPDASGGTVSVFLDRDERTRHMCLRVADDGVGLPGATEVAERPSSLGFMLVRSLVSQLNGSMSVCADGGTSVTVRFAASGCVDPLDGATPQDPSPKHT